MTKKLAPSPLLDILPIATSNEEISSLILAERFSPKYDLNLLSDGAFETTSIFKTAFLNINDFTDKERLAKEASPAFLSNIIYLDLCEKEAMSIARALVCNTELSKNYYDSVSQDLKTNYTASMGQIDAALANVFGTKKGKEILNDAKDVTFVQRFEALNRYDRWNIQDENNREFRNNPDKAFLLLMDADLCQGGFWDREVALKNRLVTERLQESINEIQKPNAMENLRFLTNSLGIETEHLSREEKERLALRLIDIAEQNVVECNMFVFEYDKQILDSLRAEIKNTDCDPLDKLREFVNGSNLDTSASLAEAVAKLEEKGSKHVNPDIT